MLCNIRPKFRIVEHVPRPSFLPIEDSVQAMKQRMILIVVCLFVAVDLFQKILENLVGCHGLHLGICKLVCGSQVAAVDVSYQLPELVMIFSNFFLLYAMASKKISARTCMCTACRRNTTSSSSTDGWCHACYCVFNGGLLS